MWLWLFNLSTRLTAHNGRVKPFPAGPLPYVCPVKLLEAVKLELGKKLVRTVEKQMKLSLRWSSPRYFVPLSPDFPDGSGVECGVGMKSSALISWRGDCESGRRN